LGLLLGIWVNDRIQGLRAKPLGEGLLSRLISIADGGYH
jgi:hypothetical protein